MKNETAEKLRRIRDDQNKTLKRIARIKTELKTAEEGYNHTIGSVMMVNEIEESVRRTISMIEGCLITNKKKIGE